MCGVADIKPVRHKRRTSFRRTLQFVAPAVVTMDFNLAASEDTFANHADASVIQRIPFPNAISAAEDIETFFQVEMLLHISNLPSTTKANPTLHDNRARRELGHQEKP
jgi:hypothetical protein